MARLCLTTKNQLPEILESWFFDWKRGWPPAQRSWDSVPHPATFEKVDETFNVTFFGGSALSDRAVWRCLTALTKSMCRFLPQTERT